MSTETTAVSSYGSAMAEGRLYQLEEVRDFPYRTSLEVFLYDGNSFYPLNRKNLVRLAPERKDAIEKAFPSNRIKTTETEKVEGIFKD